MDKKSVLSLRGEKQVAATREKANEKNISEHSERKQQGTGEIYSIRNVSQMIENEVRGVCSTSENIYKSGV